jgi:predicted regulator of Ras-like GTPase activity (Roadblock/LC7/MglB family)
MVKKKRDIQETTTAVIVEEESALPMSPEDQFTSLCASLEEIGKSAGVIGYILKNATSATVNLKDPDRLANYALFSSEMFDSGQEFSELFALGETESILVEGQTIKVLCILMGENKISIFMEKNADHAGILDIVSQ